jgi:hypothetical protein
MANTLSEGGELTESGELLNSNYHLYIVDGTLKLKNPSNNVSTFFPNPAQSPTVSLAFCVILDGVVKIKDPTTHVVLSSFGSSGHSASILVLESTGAVIIQNSLGSQIWP